MSVIISKDEHRTIIATINKKYIINQSSSKGIELLMQPLKVTEGSAKEFEIRVWIPNGTKTSTDIVANALEISIYPIPLKVLEDIQERTNGDIKIEDISEYYDTESGKEFFFRLKGYIILATM